jgi:hypothetical protein
VSGGKPPHNLERNEMKLTYKKIKEICLEDAEALNVHHGPSGSIKDKVDSVIRCAMECSDVERDELTENQIRTSRGSL